MIWFSTFIHLVVPTEYLNYELISMDILINFWNSYLNYIQTKYKSLFYVFGELAFVSVFVLLVLGFEVGLLMAFHITGSTEAFQVATVIIEAVVGVKIASTLFGGFVSKLSYVSTRLGLNSSKPVQIQGSTFRIGAIG